MKEEYKRKEEKELIKRFEEYVKSESTDYFDEESYLQIVQYYIRVDKTEEGT